MKIEMKIIGVLFLSILTTSCSYFQKENVDGAGSDSSQTHTDVMRNDLAQALKGEWVNTSLFDSAHVKKALAPWMEQFYGDIYLEITDADTALIKGNMDGADTYMKVIDKNTFSFFERVDQPVFTYSPETDLITEKMMGGKTIVFRRLKKEDPIDIIENEDLFNAYFIKEFFTDDYFKQKTKPEIVDIWNGFLTYSPFSFDALAIQTEQGKEEWYAWKFKGDTLELYSTSHTEDEESGFFIYKIGSLKERYIKSR